MYTLIFLQYSVSYSTRVFTILDNSERGTASLIYITLYLKFIYILKGYIQTAWYILHSESVLLHMKFHIYMLYCLT